MLVERAKGSHMKLPIYSSRTCCQAANAIQEDARSRYYVDYLVEQHHLPAWGIVESGVWWFLGKGPIYASGLTRG